MARSKRTARTIRGNSLSPKALGELAIRRAKQARTVIIAKGEEARSRAAGAVSQLEKAFQARVAMVAGRLGMPKSADVRALARQVAQLQQSVDQLSRARARR